MKRGGWLLTVGGWVAIGGCQPPDSSSARTVLPAGTVRFWPGVEPTTKLAADQVVVGQSVFVPIHSTIASADNARPINLAVTLTVRNLDMQAALVVHSIRYHDSGGHLIRESLPTPIRVGPLASLDLFVGESDNSGGPSPSFLVEWAADHEVPPPVVEAVMISTAGSLGITFTSLGRVITNRHR